MVKIKSAEGISKEISCISCALQKGKIKSIGDKIYESNNFEVQQDYEIPIPGFMVISSKRHIIGFADFNNEERKEFIELLCNLSKSIKQILKIEYLQVLCREDTIKSRVNPSHFHLALLPKYEWMNNYSDIKAILEYAQKNMKTKENIAYIKKIAQDIKTHINNIQNGRLQTKTRKNA